jgi:hypothetical protein
MKISPSIKDSHPQVNQKMQLDMINLTPNPHSSVQSILSGLNHLSLFIHFHSDSDSENEPNQANTLIKKHKSIFDIVQR